MFVFEFLICIAFVFFVYRLIDDDDETDDDYVENLS